MHCPRNELSGRFILCFLLFGGLLPIPALFAQDVTPQYCSEVLPEARNQLFMGGFEVAIALIEPCIESTMYGSEEELIQAYELLANVYIAVNDEAKAREVIASLLEIQPDYVPAEDLSNSNFLSLIDETRTLMAPPIPAITSVTSEDLYNTIEWSFGNTSSVTSFALYRGTEADALSLYTTLPVSDLSLEAGDEVMQTSYRDMDVAYSTRYFYALEAIGANGNPGTRSEVQSVLTPDQPIEEVADRASSREGGRKLSPWIFVGGGAVAGGVAIILASGGGGGGNGGGNGGNTPGVLPAPGPLP